MGLNFWKYAAADECWHLKKSSGSTAVGEKVAKSFVTIPRDMFSPGQTQTEDGSVLIQVCQEKRGKYAVIPGEEVLDHLPKNTLPGHTDFWYWDGEWDGWGGPDAADTSLHCLYQLRGAVPKGTDEYAKRRAAICAALGTRKRKIVVINPNPSDAADGQLYLIYLADRRRKVIGYDSTEGQVNWDKVQSAPTVGDTPLSPEQIDEFMLILKIDKYKKKIDEVNRDMNAGYYEKASKELSKIYEQMKGLALGAQVTPVTGTDAPVALVSQADGIAKTLRAALKPAGAPLPDGCKAVTAAWGGAVDTGIGALGSLWQAVRDYKQCAEFLVEHRAALAEPDKQKREQQVAALKLKYGRHPAITHILNGVLSTGSLALAANNVYFAIKGLADAGVVAQFATTISDKLGPALGLILGVGYSARLSYQAHRANALACSLAALKSRLGRLAREGSGRKLKDETVRLLVYAIESADRKVATKAVSAAAAGVSALSSTAALAGLLSTAAANFWNPLGWGLGVASFAVGGGVLVYRFYRSAVKDGEAERFTFSKEDFPRKLLKRYLTEFRQAPQSLDAYVLHTLVAIYGLDLFQVVRNYDAAVAAIARQITWT